MILHLLDGTFELFRAHFGSPARTAPDGREVGATAGLIASMLALLRDENVTHLAAATDSSIPSFRNEIFETYKDGSETPPELRAQFPLAEYALEALGIRTWKMGEFEADDALAAGTARFADEVEQIILLTPDKDMAQLVTGHKVVMFDRRKSALMDEAGVVEKFGVSPASIPDYLALVGDTADGIPGLPGWGAKSTAALLSRFGHLDQIPPDPLDWGFAMRGAPKLAKTLAERMDDALLYRTLATLRPDAPISGTLAELEWKGVYREPYLALCEELGLETLQDRPHQWVQ